jgi:hypothetical protein
MNRHIREIVICPTLCAIYEINLHKYHFIGGEEGCMNYFII